VQKGENLTVIARRYGVTLNALVAANPKMSPRRLMPGAQLKVPRSRRATTRRRPPSAPTSRCTS
jgi:LysM repeat protein